MKHTLTASLLGYTYNWEVDLPNGVPSLVIEAARKGFQEWMQDSKAGEDTPEGRKQAMDERYDKIVTGAYVPGKGGGGRKLNVDNEALHRFLIATGRDGKKGDLEARLLSFIAAAAIAQGTATKETAMQVAKDNRDTTLEAIMASEVYLAKVEEIKAEAKAKADKAAKEAELKAKAAALMSGIKIG